MNELWPSGPKRMIWSLLRRSPLREKYFGPEFKVPHDLRYTVLWWNTHKHVYVIFARLCFMYFYSLILAQLSQHFSDIFFYLSIDNLPAVLWGKDDMVFTFPLRVC